MGNNNKPAPTETTTAILPFGEITPAISAAVRDLRAAKQIQDPVLAGIATASATQRLRDSMSPDLMRLLMQLQNTPLGFLTDKRAGGYSVDEVRDCMIVALGNLIGLIGNQFNIIGGRMYITKEGFHALLMQLHDTQGLLFHVTAGIPRAIGEKGAIVPVHVEWTYAGKSNTQDLELPTRINSGMGVDALKGKATRKAYAWLYEEITGNACADGDVDDVEMVDITPRQAAPAPARMASPLPQLQAM